MSQPYQSRPEGEEPYDEQYQTPGESQQYGQQLSYDRPYQPYGDPTQPYADPYQTYGAQGDLYANPAAPGQPNPYADPTAYGQPNPYGQEPTYSQEQPYGYPVQPGQGQPSPYQQPAGGWGAQAGYSPAVQASLGEQPMSWRTILAFVVSAIAIVFIPVLFGGLGIIFANMGVKRGEKGAKAARGVAIACLLVGIVLGILAQMSN